MRVISGAARGRKLLEPVGHDIRPTADMVKESIFNMIQFDIEGRRALDLFAGTGQLGIEALSRGARDAVFVDMDPAAVKLIRGNLKICGFTESATVYARDALRFLEGGAIKNAKFDLIFIDPPYDSIYAYEAIQKILEFDKLVTNGIMICEMGADRLVPAVSPPYFLCKCYKYGRVNVSRYSRG